MAERRSRGPFPWRGMALLLCTMVGGCQLEESFLQDAPVGKAPADAYDRPRAGALTSGSGPRVAQAAHQEEELPRPMPAGPPALPAPSGPGVPADCGPAAPPIPRELTKTTHPAYVLEPPDILVIRPIRMIPLPPYRVEPLDVLQIQVAETLPNQPLNGPYSVTPDGVITLPYGYGVVRVAGLTLEQAAQAMRTVLARSIKEPQVSVGLLQFRAVEQVTGEHLIGQDGTIALGSYGCVYVTGLTLSQAKLAIERHLARFLLNPEVSLAVAAYNSKVYYVIADGAGFGQSVNRLPITGNETVLDAISFIGGLPPVASKRRIWLARPAPNKDCYQILPIDWEALTQGADPATNYQIFPGDRIYVSGDPLITLDNTLAKIFAPVERVLGLTLLGSTTYWSLRSNPFNNSRF